MGITIIGKSGVVADVDANTRALLVSGRPGDLGRVVGSYKFQSTPGSDFTVGSTTDEVVLTARWTNAYTLAVLREIRVGILDVGTVSTNLGVLKGFIARAWTVGDTGALATPTATALSGYSQKSGKPNSKGWEWLIAGSTPLSGVFGSRTLDAAPFGTLIYDYNISVSSRVSKDETSRLFYASGAMNHPIVLTQNEGFTIHNQANQSGQHFRFNIEVSWDEVARYP